MRRDLVGAYLASIGRLGSWAVASAVVFRHSVEAFAVLALVRGTIGILNYVALGLQPAMVRAFAERRSEYFPDEGAPKVYRTGMSIALVTVAVGIVAAFVCGALTQHLYELPPLFRHDNATQQLVIFFSIGIAVRWLADPASAFLQTHGSLFFDNLFQAISDYVWAGIILLIPSSASPGNALRWVGFSYLLCGLLLVALRIFVARRGYRWEGDSSRDSVLARHLLFIGGLITLAQLADFLYAPTDYILINRLLTAKDLADYAPAVQIDASLMILVTGLASVVLPRAAVAHTAGNIHTVRRYYVVGTLGTGGMLAVAGIVTWLASPWIFRLWFGTPLPGAQAILPLMMLHLVIGGSSAVGRSILIGIGKAKPLTIAVLLGGATNVAFSFGFVKFGHMGLRGIVLGTIVAVTARCAIWMPWYVMKELNRENVKT